MSLVNIDWDFALLEELIEARGTDVVIETGVSCVCRNEDTFAAGIEIEGAPGQVRLLNCPKCQGDGYIYRNARIIKGLLTSIEVGKNRRLIDIGYASPGDAIFSPSLNAGIVCDFDRITFIHSEPLHEGQVILRNAANLYENQTLLTDLNSDEDRLWYAADCSIWCEDINGVIYTQNTDFEFEDRKIRWTGNRPKDKTLYTIKYMGFPEWIVYSTPFDRVDRDRDLAQKAILRKKHVMFNSGSLADTPSKRQGEQSAFTTRTKI